MYIMGVISLGVCIASYGALAACGLAQTRARPATRRGTRADAPRRRAGELAFVLAGVLFQLGSILTESNRIVLLQMLLQSKGIKLNPITSMYYILPCCLGFLFIPWLAIEYPRLSASAGERVWLDANGMFIFLTNAAAAFTLNCSVFLLIGKSSALTMNIAGVVKDWLLIYLSWVIFEGPITALNLFGYGVAFSAVCWYNYVKLRAMGVENAKKEGEAKPAGDGGDGKADEEAAELPPLSAASGDKDQRD